MRTFVIQAAQVAANDEEGAAALRLQVAVELVSFEIASGEQVRDPFAVKSDPAAAPSWPLPCGDSLCCHEDLLLSRPGKQVERSEFVVMAEWRRPELG